MIDETPEFSRLVEVSRIPPEGLDEIITADRAECERLAVRLGVERLLALTATFSLTPWRHGGVRVKGHFEAEIEQICVVSLDPFITTLSEEVERFFAGHSEPGWSGQVHDVDSLEGDEPDLVHGGEIDLGELTAEELVLAIDPYPHKPGAKFAGGDEDLADKPREASQNPFLILEKLTKK